MADDLVRRLREEQPVTQDMESTAQCDLQDEAADRIDKLEAERDEIMREALSLARSLHKAHYSDVTQWESLTYPAGVVSQIDNMVAGIVARAEAAEAKLAKVVELLEWQTRLVDNNITPNSETTHRINIAGAWYTGPVVDWTHSVLTSWKKINRTTLAALKGPTQ